MTQAEQTKAAAEREAEAKQQREVDLRNYEGEIIDELLRARNILPVGTTGDQVREIVPVFLRVTKIVLDRHK